MICGKIVPRQNEVVGERRDGYLAECILPEHHKGHHIIKIPEGKYFAWRDDESCECCGPEESDPCYIFWEMSADEVTKLL